MKVRLLIAALAIVMAAPGAHAEETLAVLPFEIIVEDTLEGIPIAKPAEKKRLQLVTAEVVQLAAASGRYKVADTTPVAADIEKESPFFKCNGCEVEVAKKVNAGVVLTGLVQKGSETTASISFALRSVATGELVRTGGITVLENSDEAWIRGIRRLVKSRLLGEDATK